MKIPPGVNDLHTKRLTSCGMSASGGLKWEFQAAVLCFIPGWNVYVFKGFEALQQAPEWYLIAFGTAVAASFGMRNIVPYFKKGA